MLLTQRKAMDDYLDFLSGTSLFANIPPMEIKSVLESTGARTAEYNKGDTVIPEGSAVSEVGIVLDGLGRSVKHDKSGKALIITLLKKGSFIGVLLAASVTRKSPVTIQAVENMKTLFISFDGLLRCDCPCREALLRNCFNCVAEKSMMLYDRIECLIRPTVREKITSYLTRLADDAGSPVFMAPLDRSAMADYLNVDRSALSRELSAMRREGLIDFYKSSFKLFYL